MSKGSKVISFRVGTGFLREELEARDYQHDSQANELARRDLERFYDLLRRTLQTVDLTASEASAICDANNGTFWDRFSYKMIWANVADSAGLGEKWGVDQAALVKKMMAWDHSQCLAVIDAVERFWVDCQNSTVHSVGLARE